jgi:pilus assembly protein CpaE
MSFSAVIASQNRLLRQEIRNRLSQEGIACAGEISDIREAVAVCLGVRPQVLLVDAAFGEPVFAVIGQVTQGGEVGVIVLGEELDPAMLRGAMQAGARDYVLVRTEGQRLGDSIRRVGAAVSVPQQVQRAVAGPGKVVTVFSTKGGVGKTTIASNLATAMALASGRDVALVDLDLEFGGAASMFGAHTPASILDLCRLDGSIDPTVVDKVMVPAKLAAMGGGRHRRAAPMGEVKILAAPQSPDLAAEVDGDARRRPGYNYVADILEALVMTTPYVVIDTGSSFRDTNLTALDRADTILLVTTPDILALQNTGKCLEILLHRLEYPAEKIMLVMNQADMAVGVSVQEISRGLDFPVAHRLPHDSRTVIWAANCGQPFVLTTPRSKVAESIVSLARQIAA